MSTHKKAYYFTKFAGFVYPVITHWTWDSTGWLANGPEGIAFKVMWASLGLAQVATLLRKSEESRSVAGCRHVQRGDMGLNYNRGLIFRSQKPAGINRFCHYVGLTLCIPYEGQCCLYTMGPRAFGPFFKDFRNIVRGIITILWSCSALTSKW